jgi:hypothetical protein
MHRKALGDCNCNTKRALKIPDLTVNICNERGFVVKVSVLLFSLMHFVGRAKVF